MLEEEGTSRLSFRRKKIGEAKYIKAVRDTCFAAIFLFSTDKRRPEAKLLMELENFAIFRLRNSMLDSNLSTLYLFTFTIYIAKRKSS